MLTNIETERVRKGLTQEQLASQVEKDVSNVQNEHGVLVRRRAEKGFISL